MTRPRPDHEVGGYTVTARSARVFLIDRYPASDPGMSAQEARALAAALVVAATTAERQARRRLEQVVKP